jgi:hypothetical protein
VLIKDRDIDERAEKPVFLTGRKPYTVAWRRELAWMVVRSKPFSRAMVNRTWYWLMGRGLVNPVDGWSRGNREKVPDLLDALAADLRENDYPLRVRIRKICSSQAYQRQSVAGGEVATSEVAGEKFEAFFVARTIRQQLPERWLTSVTRVLDRPLPYQARVAEQAVRLTGRTQASQTDNYPYDWSATTQSLINQLAGEIPPPLRGLREIYLAMLARGPPMKKSRYRKATAPKKSCLHWSIATNLLPMTEMNVLWHEGGFMVWSLTWSASTLSSCSTLGKQFTF